MQRLYQPITSSRKISSCQKFFRPGTLATDLYCEFKLSQHAFFLFLSLSFFSISSFADPIFKIDNGTNQTINKHGTCRKITNNSGKDIMIPTGTQTQWESFVNNANIAGVTKTSCAPCDGVTVGSVDTSGAICAGTFQGIKYMITPGGCTDQTNPDCAGTADTVKKTWRGSSGTNADVPLASNISGYATPASQTGFSATKIITNHTSISANSAAHFCDGMTFGGFSDWYLPNKTEMAYLFCNSNRSGSRTAGHPQEQPDCAGDFNGPTTLLTNFAAGYYWTSTEYNSGNAWAQYFDFGVQNYDTNCGIITGCKASSVYVRCMRQFDPNAFAFDNIDSNPTTAESSTVTISGLLSSSLDIYVDSGEDSYLVYEYRINGGAYVVFTPGSVITVSNGDTLNFRFTWTYCGGTIFDVRLRKTNASGGTLDYFRVKLGFGVCPS